ncbi:MAG TPA: 50S ribosomal protein L29 [Phycisphaerae bacterium]|jgi:large subunit ribosomal protein L29|nr:50S ribosomal protein L29 [Phycisphaerae bacterium]
MASETLNEYRGMSGEQLHEHEEELRTKLFKLKTTASTEKVKDVSQFQKIKKDIARLKTIQREQELKKQNAKAQA